MLKIRFRRMGTTNSPFYRVVVSDSRRTPISRAVEELGYYDPTKDPAVFKVDHERVNHWVGRGAQLSDTLRRLVQSDRKAQSASA